MAPEGRGGEGRLGHCPCCCGSGVPSQGSKRLPSGSRHTWSLRPRGYLVTLCVCGDPHSSPAESRPSGGAPSPPPTQLPLRRQLSCPLGPPQWEPARPPRGPSQLPPSAPCLPGLLSLHSICH